jgi:histidyl-tRNA synthetase
MFSIYHLQIQGDPDLEQQKIILEVGGLLAPVGKSYKKDRIEQQERNRINMTTLQTLKGFRDFLPEQKRQRDFVVAKVIEAFELAGFEPLETPTLEYSETIMGKYGAEADKLVYQFEDRGGRSVAMRYDQTVPTARVIAQYQQELPMPFRRYQIQNVFRADKPQKGRYREFTQCDIDVFGSSDPLADAEILATTYLAYRNIGFASLELRINDRQTLMSTLAPYANEQVNVLSIIQSVDKLDKMSSKEVVDELVSKGLDQKSAEQALVDISSVDPSQQLAEIMKLAQSLGVPAEVLRFTPTIARGLDYYTGMIFEIAVPELTGSSLGGGGRYDNLIGDLSGVSVPAVGVAFGFDRTVEAAIELGLIPVSGATAEVLVTVFSEDLQDESVQATRELREAGISTQLYPQVDKLGKQFKYASRCGIPYVLVIGEDEAKEGIVTLKDLTSGEQRQVTMFEVIDQLGINDSCCGGGGCGSGGCGGCC